MTVYKIESKKILNSAAKWTIETTLILSDGSIGIASVPGGISKGATEVATVEEDQAVENVKKLKNKIENVNFDIQSEFDNFLIKQDGTPDKSNLGGNTLLSLSVAFCKAVAKSKKLETYQHISEEARISLRASPPKIQMLIMEGGLHGSSKASIQEFMVVVDKISSGVDVYAKVKAALISMGKSTNVGAEGAFSPADFTNEECLLLLAESIGGNKIALDIAAGAFPASQDLPNYIKILEQYPISSIEDPFAESDWNRWKIFAQRYLPEVMIVGDDLTTTNLELVQKAINEKAINGVIIKPNQIGTVSETLEVVKLAKSERIITIISHRGTDTNDDFIADLAAGVSADFVKFGSPARGERVAKYNRLIEIYNNQII